MGIYDHVTTKHFLAKILYFKADKKPELAFQIVLISGRLFYTSSNEF